MIEKGKEAYTTHFNYINCLCSLTKNLKLEYDKNLNNKDLTKIDTKLNLIKLTKRSIEDELNIVRVDKEYSYASTSWLPVKSYYLVYNMLLTIEYCIDVQDIVFNKSHTACMDYFTKKLKNGSIKFSNHLLNEVFDYSIVNKKFVSGSNLSPKTPIDDMYEMAMRKIAGYKCNEWKRNNNIKNLRSQKNKKAFSNYEKTFSVSIFDFLYYMRIRSNYRDFAFVEGVSIDETAKYFETFYCFTMNLTSALEGLKDNLINQRSLIKN